MRRGVVVPATVALFLEPSEKISSTVRDSAGSIPGAEGSKRGGQAGALTVLRTG